MATPRIQVGPGVEVACRPQGTCPKPWVILINGTTMFDRRGGTRRFGSQEAATKRARVFMEMGE